MGLSEAFLGASQRMLSRRAEYTKKRIDALWILCTCVVFGVSWSVVERESDALVGL